MSGIVNVNTDYINDVLNRAKVTRRQASGELGRSEWYLNNLCHEAGRFRFRMLCRECAYAYGCGVIEKDGNTYEYTTDFKE